METASQVVLSAALGLLLAFPAFGATSDEPNGAPVTAAGEYYDYHSALAGRDYRIFLYVPSGPAPAAGFPVIYMLDGNWLFNMVTGAAALQFATGETPSGILVGIGYPTNSANEITASRTLDLGLPASPDQLPPRLRQTPTGGADEFYKVLTQEIRPFVERHASIDRSCETLFGHSLGGLFVLHVAFTHPEAFRSYVAASPAIWWGGDVVLKDEAAFEAKLSHGNIKQRLLLTIGGLETRSATTPLPPGGSDRHMLENIISLSARLTPYRSPTFEFENDVLADEMHNSSLPAAISKGLRFGLCAPRN